MDTVQSRVLTASQKLNDVTGYSGIESIKEDNNKLEAELAAAHERVRTARLAYKTSNTKRAVTQREVTTLLARKDGWSPTDLERFTELYRTDHVLEGEVAAATENLTDAEREEQSLNQRLNAGILKRYHEEQIWSDRIRRASTWGTWGLMGMNFLLFVVLQFVAEPWKRKRLVRGVVEHEKSVLEEVRAELAAVKAALVAPPDTAVAEIPAVASEVVIGDLAVVESDGVEVPIMEKLPPPLTWQEFLTDPAHWKAFASDLVSERRLNLTMREASILALEGVAAGIAVAGTTMLLFLPR